VYVAVRKKSHFLRSKDRGFDLKKRKRIYGEKKGETPVSDPGKSEVLKAFFLRSKKTVSNFLLSGLLIEKKSHGDFNASNHFRQKKKAKFALNRRKIKFISVL
jgi:hypothetical protein